MSTAPVAMGYSELVWFSAADDAHPLVAPTATVAPVVLLRLRPTATSFGERIWPGYHDGTCWRLADGSPLADDEVLGYAHLSGLGA